MLPPAMKPQANRSKARRSRASQRSPRIHVTVDADTYARIVAESGTLSHSAFVAEAVAEYFRARPQRDSAEGRHSISEP